ncbi:GNAT family N-acetyltransferase [Bacillus sp. sid0103]|uniref:GNAT family N-acetyltransferase n=1 Tax=Bacillus sp. sid0103 TaxID=2856337 RepID=UPI0021092229|nr:GNAT family N-acetyltransferase [Bacillus sp. sid0103]
MAEMIKKIDLHNMNLTEELLALQRAAYLVEAELINFFEIPPLVETINELRDCEESFIGYFLEGKLVGAISYTITGDVLTICRMIVHPAHFRKGIAQRLLVELEDINPLLAVYKVSTGKANSPAKHLYLKNGYTFIGDFEVVPGLYISNFEKRKVEA